MGWPLWATLLAATPVLLLATLVLSSRPLVRAAWWAAGYAFALSMTVFGLNAVGAVVAAARGLWTGSWILLIVVPALLLFRVLDRSGALDRLACGADRLAPTPGRQLLLFAWVLPSFLQGAAGFGAPIAMTAPLLVRRGMAPAAAVAACLIGYQWSVTFGSMGSSYFMAEATARLDADMARSFALRAAILLAVNAVMSGLLVLRHAERHAGDRWRVVGIGSVMGTALVAVVAFQPALGSTAAGLAGLVACWWLLPDRGTARPPIGELVAAASPYLVLTGAATIGFAVPVVRDLLDRLPAVAPSLPGTTAGFGFDTPATALNPAFRPLLHPLPYLVLAILVAVSVAHRKGWWRDGARDGLARSWLEQSRRVALPILGLTVFASVLTESGITTAIATSLAAGLGRGFVVVSGPIGALGTVLTGSTTASNALFSPLQAQIAAALAIAPAIILTGQTAGGNIGNAISPTVAAVGASAAGGSGKEGRIIRRNLPGALLLLSSVLVALVYQVRFAG